MRPRTFNDLLALVFVAGVLILWSTTVLLFPDLRQIIITATISLVGTVMGFYFRKAKGEDKPPEGG